MRLFNPLFKAVSVISLAGLAACGEGTDITPGNSSVTINNTTNGTPSPAPAPAPAPAPGASPAPGPVVNAPQNGSVGNGMGTTRNGARQADPYSIATLFNQAALNNRTSVSALVDSTGFPTQAANTSTGLTGRTFTRPAQWPPATAAANTVSLPVPDYITNVSYAGAYDPALPRAQQWTAGWTIKVNGNDDVWKFHGGTAGTALSSNTTAAVADGTCPAGTTPNSTFSQRFGALSNDEVRLFSGTAANGDYDICVLPRRFGAAGTLVLSNDNVYELAANFPGTYIGNGEAARNNASFALTASVLSIQPGTLIFGEAQEALVVTRGAQIQALGTAAAPIVMTSATQLRQRFDGNAATAPDSARGEWAGLAILGQARDTQCPGVQANGANPGNYANCDVAIEGGVGNYGGQVDNDDSGTLQYVIVRQAGNVISANVELNGITFGGVGRATRSNFVQVHRGLDDGIEWFGGNNFVGHAVLTGNDDDNLDGDNGWTGGVQFALILQETDTGNRFIEMDGRFNNLPVTFPLIANVTALGPNTAPIAMKGEDSAVLFREGLRFNVWNSIFTGSPTNNGSCLDFDDATSGLTTAPTATFNRVNEEGGSAAAPGPHLFLRNSFIDCTINFTENDEGSAPA